MKGISKLIKITFSVVIVTYRSKGVIGNCLNSLYKYNDIDEGIQVIVVDNSPIEDGTFTYIRETFPWVTLIKNKENRGFGQGNNVGAKSAVGEYLLFLNPDTVFIEPIFQYAVARFEEEPSLGLFGMILVSPEGNYRNSFGFMPEKKSFFPAIFYLPLIRYFNITPIDIFPWGADLFMRKEDFLSIGGFDENIFIGYEEPDLVRRLAGKKVRIFSKRIIHIEHHSLANIEQWSSRVLTSEEYYFTKHKLDYQRYIKHALFKLQGRLFINKIRGKRTDEITQYLIDKYKHHAKFSP